MPNLSQTLLRRFGIAVYICYLDVGRHGAPHIHVFYSDEEAVLRIPDGGLLDGSVPGRALRKTRAWIELNGEELTQRWEEAVHGRYISRVD